MKAKASFLEPRKLLVETALGDNFILIFNSDYNYQLGLQYNVPVVEFIAQLFDKHYSGNEAVIFGPIYKEIMTNNLESFLSFTRDKFKERVNLGARIKELREAKGLDFDTLATRANIEVSNLRRIEQGKYSPNFDILNNIASAMGMRFDFVELEKKD